MQPSQKCYDLVKHFEGLYLTAYLCPAGVPTIGYGHTAGVKLGDVIDEDTANTYLQSDMRMVAPVLSAMIPPTAKCTQGMFDALCSLCFNLRGGPKMLPIKAPHLWGDLVRGDKPDAAREFLDMDHALVNGKPEELPGLKARREAEMEMFMA